MRRFQHSIAFSANPPSEVSFSRQESDLKVMASSAFSAVHLAQVIALDNPLVGKATNEVEGELGLGTTSSVHMKPAVAVRTGYSTTRPPRRKSPASRLVFLDL